MDLHEKKCCDCLDEEDNKELTTQEKIKEYIEDHSDSLGCLLSLAILGGIIVGSYSLYNHCEEKHQQEVAQKIQAEQDMKAIEPLYIQKVLELSNKITNSNIKHALQAAKYLVLIETPANEKSLDMLGEKYLEIYQHAGNNVTFQEKLFEELDRVQLQNNENASTKAQETPESSVSIQFKKNPYVEIVFKNHFIHTR